MYRNLLLAVCPIVLALGLSGCARTGSGTGGSTGPSQPTPTRFSCAEAEDFTSASLLTVDDPVPGQYIVKLHKDYEELYQRIKRVRGRVRDYFGIEKVDVIPILRGFVARIPPEVLERLLEDSRIAYVEQVARMQVGPVSSTSVDAPWGLDRINQRDLPLDGNRGFAGSGSGVHVYVIDTGIDSDHPAFAGRVGAGFSAHPGGPEDQQGHGTHVAGTIAGRALGVADQVRVHSVRVLDASGAGTSQDIIRGIQWVTEHAKAKGWPAIANMSLGGGRSKAVDDAVCASIAAGVTYVAAAGNEARDACKGSPARVDEVLTVAATDRSDQRPRFSNFGECVDIFAPGRDIKSAWLGGGTRTESGTSMAAPHVSGVAALCAERGRRGPGQVRSCVLGQASSGRVGNPGAKSPNRLLFTPSR